MDRRSHFDALHLIFRQAELSSSGTGDLGNLPLGDPPYRGLEVRPMLARAMVMASKLSSNVLMWSMRSVMSRPFDDYVPGDGIV